MSETAKQFANPMWMDRPNVPGMWVCIGKDIGFPRLPPTVLNLAADDITNGAPFHVSRVFGPIPPARLCKCGKVARDVTGYCDDCFGG